MMETVNLKEKTRAPLSATRGHSKKAAGCKPGREASPEANHAGTLILEFPASRSIRNEHLLFKPPSQ